MQELPAISLEEIESRMLAMPQAECPVVHRFAPGLYIREAHMPTGALVIGHEHRAPQLNNLIQGRILLLREDGTQQEFSAPMTFVGPAGRKVGYILEDVIWQNIYPTEEQDIDKLEDLLLIKSEVFTKALAELESPRLLENKQDFQLFLEEEQLSPEYVREVSESLEDQIPMPEGWTKTCIRNSPIDGKGLFATCPFDVGMVIAPTRIGGKRTPAGRFTNHSPAPNAEMVQIGDDVVLVAISRISGCLAGGDGEEVTVDYREVLKLNRAMALGEGVCPQ